MSLGIPIQTEHTHAASEITSGTLADARIAQSNVTQHEAALDHGSIAGLADDDHPQYALAGGSRWTTTQTADRAVVSSGSGALVVSAVTAAELDALSGVTSAIQTQLDGKAASGHSHALDDLADVNISSPAADHVLKYSGGIWTNGPMSGSGPDELAELVDVDLSSPASGNLLTYNGTDWINSAPAFVSNAGISSPATGQVLAFNGSSWVNQSLTSADVAFGDIATDTVTGMAIGTSVFQKIGFWATSPVTQPSGASQGTVTLNTADGAIAGLSVSSPPTQGEVEALRDACETLADDVASVLDLVHALRSALVLCGLIKGSA